MISVASTLLLVSLLFSGVSAAPVGTRSMDVKTMRRMAETPTPRDTTTVPVPRNIPDVVAKIHDDATHVHVRRKVLPRHVPRGRVVEKGRGAGNVARDAAETKPAVVVKRAPKPTPEAEKTPVPRDPVDNVARADPDRAKKFAMRSEPVEENKTKRVHKRDPELVVRSIPNSDGDKIVKRDGGNDAVKVVVKRDPELVVKRAEPREEKPKPKSLYSSGASPREVKEEEKKKRDDVRGPIGPIAMFRRTLENLD